MANESALGFNSKISQNSNEVYWSDGGGNDDYVITLVPAVTAYVQGQIFTFRANTANTLTASLNVNTLGAIQILKSGRQALETNDIRANQIISVVYDAVTPSFEMVSPVGFDVPAVASAIVMAAGASTTTFASPLHAQSHLSACKAWIKWAAGAAGPVHPPIVSSYNFAGATGVWNAAGDYTFTFTNAFADANYAVVCTGSGATSIGRTITVKAQTTTTIRIGIATSAGNAIDDDGYLACFGTQV